MTNIGRKEMNEEEKGEKKRPMLITTKG